MEWHENEVKNGKVSNCKEVTRYIHCHEENIDKKTTEKMQKWMAGLRNVNKEVKMHGNGDIRRYINFESGK